MKRNKNWIKGRWRKPCNSGTIEDTSSKLFSQAVEFLYNRVVQCNHINSICDFLTSDRKENDVQNEQYRWHILNISDYKSIK